MEQGEVWGGLSPSGGGRPVRGGRRAASWLAGAAVLGALLTGCSEAEPEPSPPPVTATPAPTPSETPEELAAPERPAEMERTDEVGAMAAAEYFMELFAYVMATGDLEEWDRVSGQTCSFCANVREDVDATYSEGGRIVGGGVEVSSIEVLLFEETLVAFAVEAQYRVAAGAEEDADGTVVRELPEESGWIVLDLAEGVRGWQILEGSTHDESQA
ncbi:hypothetical protein J4G33_06635 [Actinotalea sp. BY-33]|uniref:DUF6318 domain-containing protein n=1 Tax=Actinotalea soli TaxID=2819234 RepID=A0A939RVC6_9CELL|nr:DUF6318 family protein [Actinotalea soli]MBO1751478.1 hypothetical protein [Actinotalea soli]